MIDLAAELGVQAQNDDAAPAPVALLGVGGLPAADITSVAVEPGVDMGLLLRDEDVGAVLVGDELTGLRLVGLQSVSTELETLVTAASSELQVAEAAERGGLSPEEVAAITQPTPPVTELLDVRPEGTMPPEFLVLVFAFLFYLSVLTFGMSIAQSVVEEKQSRVVELLVAAMPVRWLLAGKVIGNTIMAVGQVVVIVGAGLLGAVVAGQGELISQVLGASGLVRALLPARLHHAGLPVGRRRVAGVPHRGPQLHDRGHAGAGDRAVLRRDLPDRAELDAAVAVLRPVHRALADARAGGARDRRAVGAVCRGSDRPGHSCAVRGPRCEAVCGVGAAHLGPAQGGAGLARRRPVTAARPTMCYRVLHG